MDLQVNDCFKYRWRSCIESFLLVGGSVSNLTCFHKHDVLAATDNNDSLLLAFCALQSQSYLLCGLGLLLEDRLSLTSIAYITYTLYQTAYDRNGVCLERQCSPCPSCTGQPCAVCVSCTFCTGNMSFLPLAPPPF
jgi:hypothetical protein